MEHVQTSPFTCINPPCRLPTLHIHLLKCTTTQEVNVRLSRLLRKHNACMWFLVKITTPSTSTRLDVGRLFGGLGPGPGVYSFPMAWPVALVGLMITLVGPITSYNGIHWHVHVWTLRLQHIQRRTFWHIRYSVQVCLVSSCMSFVLSASGIYLAVRVVLHVDYPYHIFNGHRGGGNSQQWRFWRNKLMHCRWHCVFIMWYPLRLQANQKR